LEKHLVNNDYSVAGDNKSTHWYIWVVRFFTFLIKWGVTISCFLLLINPLTPFSGILKCPSYIEQFSSGICTPTPNPRNTSIAPTVTGAALQLPQSIATESKSGSFSIKNGVIKFHSSKRTIDLKKDSELKKFFGQIFITGVDSDAFENDNKTDWDSNFDDLKIGGVFLDRRNLRESGHKETTVKDAKNLQDVLLMLQRMKKMEIDGEYIPRFVSADHEGGNVSQLMKRGYASSLPAPMGLAAIGSENAIRESSRIAAEELKLLGINLKLGPVVDVNTERENRDIKDRSFSGNHNVVSQASKIEVNTNKSNNIISVIKHYPGHGHTKAGFATPNPPESNQNNVGNVKESLIPFYNLSNLTPAIMTSHMTINVLGIKNVTTNKKIIRDLLRSPSHVNINGHKFKGLNYKGLIISDNLNEPSFAAVRADVQKIKDEKGRRVCQRTDILRDKYLKTIKNNLKLAFDAGHDIFLFSHIFDIDDDDKPSAEYQTGGKDWCARWAMNFNDFVEIYKSLKSYVFSEENQELKRVRTSQLRESIIRILETKNKYLFENKPAKDESHTLSELLLHNQECADSLIADSITVRRATTADQNTLHFLSNLSTKDKVLFLSFVNKSLKVSVKDFTKLKHRYHRHILDNIAGKVNKPISATGATENSNQNTLKELNNFYRNGNNNVVVKTLKASPADKNEVQILANIILDSIKNRGFNKVVFSTDQHYLAWRTVQIAIQRIVNDNLIEPQNIHSVITKNPVILSDTDSDYRPTLQQTNIYAPYSTYEKGAKIQIDQLFLNHRKFNSSFPFDTNNLSTSIKNLGLDQYRCVSP